MTYDQMNQELSRIPMFGKAAGLDNLSACLQYLDHPEASLRVIHVAGTNGKGSVCAFVESVLRRAGFRTGLFTSPHLVRINERIRLNFAPCRDEEMVRAYLRIKALMENREGLGLRPLTYFEVLFLMSLLIFRDAQPDYCIMETGLGGRLDATVLTHPVLCIITSISLDHMAVLGDTEEEIAREKAGIIKPQVPVAVLREKESVYQVFQEEAGKKQAPLYAVEGGNIRNFKKNVNYIDFSIENRYYNISKLRIHTTADYQASNALLAATALHLLLPGLSDTVMRDGLSLMRWEGRMEEIRPGLYVDGAHNPGAMERICEICKPYHGSLSLLFAVCRDKDYRKMISILASVPWKRIYVTRFDQARTAGEEEVSRIFQQCCDREVIACSGLPEALQRIRTARDKPVLCVGSLYFVGEIKRLFMTPDCGGFSS